jgi:hypothetical protein
VARRDAWKDGRGVRGPAAVRVSDAALSEQGSVGPVTHGPRPTVGARGRGEVRGRVGQPGEKRTGLSLDEQKNFLQYEVVQELWASSSVRPASLQCTAMQQHDAVLLTECGGAVDKTRHTHAVEDII